MLLNKGSQDSLSANRPKRICRLPSKLADHSSSPTKFIPLKTFQLSEKLITNKKKKKTCQNTTTTVNNSKRTVSKQVELEPKCILEVDKTLVNKENNVVRDKENKHSSSNSKEMLVKRNPKRNVKRLVNQNYSIQVLEGKRKTTKNIDSDVYEFTFDPNEEPQPPKKKNRTVKKKCVKPKAIRVKNNYNKNIAKALADLKNLVSNKRQQSVNNLDNGTVIPSNKKITILEDVIVKPVTSKLQCSIKYSKLKNTVNNIAEESGGNTDLHMLNYSPISSPHCDPLNPLPSPRNKYLEESHSKTDPLNLRNDISFFDECPIASSSMNVSVRQMQGSPWRIEFNDLPFRWQQNAHIKANMTPAIDSSFVNCNDAEKKHVYTNIIPQESTESNIFKEVPQLKQTSLLSSIKKMVDKSTKNNSIAKSETPIKINSIFEDITNIHDNLVQESHHFDTPNKQEVLKLSPTKKKYLKEENSKQFQHNVSLENNVPVNTPSKQRYRKGTLFGFDDSEDLEQENFSPDQCVKNRVKQLRSRKRAVLHEMNQLTGPVRMVLPAQKRPLSITIPSKCIEFTPLGSPVKEAVNHNIQGTLVNKDSSWNQDIEDDSQSVHLFEDLEVVHPTKPAQKKYGKAKRVIFLQGSDSDAHGTNIELSDSSDKDELYDLTFKVPAFEKKKTKKRSAKKDKINNLELPQKRYGRTRQVTSLQQSVSNHDTQRCDETEQSDSGEEDDVSFDIKGLGSKKIKSRQRPTKKDKVNNNEKETAAASAADVWAAELNSMFEDVDEFPLVVE